MVRQAPVICVMAPPIHLGAWSMLWLPFELLLLRTFQYYEEAQGEYGEEENIYDTAADEEPQVLLYGVL